MMGRFVGINPMNGTIVGFATDFKRIIELGVSSSAAKETVLEERKESMWGYCWRSQADLPRFTGSCIANKDDVEAILKWHTKKPKEKYIPVPAELYRNFRYSRQGKWVNIPFSIQRSHVYIVHGRLVVVAEGYVTFLLAGGKSQTLKIDGSYRTTHVVPQGKTAVWINTGRTLRRMELTICDENGDPQGWVQTEEYSLQPYAFDVVGPWFAGETGYFISDTVLYSFPAPLD